MLHEPVRPGRPARLAHDNRARVGRRRLRARLLDAVVSDHRRGEGDDLLGEARVGDDLLVAGHRGREHGLAEGEALRADRFAGKDGAVLERQKAFQRFTSCFESHSPCSR